jgi:hypothetical protein
MIESKDLKKGMYYMLDGLDSIKCIWLTGFYDINKDYARIETAYKGVDCPNKIQVSKYQFFDHKVEALYYLEQKLCDKLAWVKEELIKEGE